MSMNTSNVDLVRLLPQFMREDGAAQGIGEVVSAFVQEMSAAADLLAGWDKLERLPEAQLDEIAYELNFSSTALFSESFRKFYGAPPHAYRSHGGDPGKIPEK